MEKIYALRSVRLLLCILSFLIWTGNSMSQTHTPRNITVNNNCHGFYEYLPVNYSSGTSFPLIIFIHGIGEAGNGTTDLGKVLANGPPRLIKDSKWPASFTAGGKSYSFIVLSPQFVGWPSATDINDIYNYALAHYKVDINRVYVTGLSMGGGATWTFAGNSTAFASKIAALLPVCGATTLSQANADNISSASLPVWATHNKNDGTVSVNNTITNVSEINSKKPKPSAKESIFNASGHNAWTKTYDPNWRDSGYNVYEWMLMYSRNLTGGNQLPVANAGADQSISLPTNSVTLNASGSFDADGSISTYKWTEVSGPATFSLANSSAATTAVSNLVQGNYVFRIAVTDNKGATATDDVTINVAAAVANKAPKADAGPDQDITLPISSVTLNGSKSNDPGGSIASYKWTEISGPTQFTISNSAIVSPILTTLVHGMYVFRLTVTDNMGATASDDVTINVADAVNNQTPVANAGADQTIVLPANSVKLNGSASKDPGGSIASYKWVEISGPAQYTLSSATIVSPSLTNLMHGAYVFRLTVTDNAGATATDDVTINVAVPNQGNKTPVANAGSNVTITLPTNSVTLNGSASKDADGSISKYAWTKVSGGNYAINNAALVSPTVSGLLVGTYVFQLTVTDNGGATGSTQVTITVKSQSVVSTGIRTRVLIDAGMPTLTTSKDAWGKYWNNMTDARGGVRVSNAVDTANQPTTVGLEVINRIDGAFDSNGDGMNGTNTTGNVGDYPASATNDFAFAHESTTSGKWRIFGLSASKTYTVKFWGAKSYASARIIRIKRSDQSAWQSYDAQNNTDYNRAAIFTVSGLTEVSFDIQVQSGTFGYINVVDILAVDQAAVQARTTGAETELNTKPEEVNVDEHISMYPNPASDQAQLMIRDNYQGPVKLVLMTSGGVPVKEITTQKSGAVLLQNVQLNNLASGVYYIRVQLGKEFKVVKFIKK